MFENPGLIAALWMGLALVASLISIRVGISVALIEILVGVAAGNIHFGDGQHNLARHGLDEFPGHARQRRAHVPGRGGD